MRAATNKNQEAQSNSLPGSSGIYSVMEHFYTIQGEGQHQGKAAYFIRLGGCDVGCTWCDVKDSWNREGHPQLTVQELVAAVKNTPAAIAVITGGEPTLHDLQPLTAALQKENIATHIETSGSSPLTGSWNWICVSPKKFKAPLTDLLSRAHELKIVVFNKSDFDWAEKHAGFVSNTCKLFLQPEWSRSEPMTPLIIDYIKENPQWELSLQIHKFVNIP